MPERIIQVSKEELEKRIREGKITLPGDKIVPSPIESKPIVVTASTNTPVNTLGGSSIDGIGRRSLLLGGAMALGSLTLFGIKECPIYNPPPTGLYKKILDTPFTADELPSGWEQVRSYPERYQSNNSASLLTLILQGFAWQGVRIDIHMPGDRDVSTMRFFEFLSSEKAQTEFKELSKLPGDRSVSGIGDMALFYAGYYYNPPYNARFIIAVDRVFICVLGGYEHADDQTQLNLGNSAVKYLARIGVTSKKP